MTEWICLNCGTIGTFDQCEVCYEHRPSGDAEAAILMQSRMSPQEVAEIGNNLGQAIMDAIGKFQALSPRTQQTALGFSSLGGCREFIRATVAGDVQVPPIPKEGVSPELKWAAYVGSAVGDYTENKIKEIPQEIRAQISELLGEPLTTQEILTLELAGGIRVTGSCDLRGETWILDFKTKDGLGTVRREGPSFKEQAQVCGYLVAAIQKGLLPDTATGHLVYLDRSGKDPTSHVWSIDYWRALVVLEAVAERISNVEHALETGQMAQRDETTTFCMSIGCPFRMNCWAGYYPTEEITNPEVIAAAESYVIARDDEKDAKDRKEAARQALKGQEGVTPDLAVKWVSKQTKYGLTETIEVRPRVEIPA